MTDQFDRLRRRSARVDSEPGLPPAPAPDAHGKRVLFSATEPRRSLGTVAVDCSSCGQVTPVSAASLVRRALPSVHLPGLRRGHSSWMRCPACGRRTWVRLRLML